MCLISIVFPPNSRIVDICIEICLMSSASFMHALHVFSVCVCNFSVLFCWFDLLNYWRQHTYSWFVCSVTSPMPMLPMLHCIAKITWKLAIGNEMHLSSFIKPIVTWNSVIRSVAHCEHAFNVCYLQLHSIIVI